MLTDIKHPVKPRILVVDDEKSNRDLLRNMLEPACEVELAQNGETALTAVSHHYFDVILLDLMMPDVSGLTVLERIREDKSLADLPVIIISAIDRHKDIARGIRMGANDYIPRPIQLDVLLARVHTQVKLKRFADERQQVIASLQASNEMKVRLMQVASHDLRGPMTNLKMLHKILRGYLNERTPTAQQTETEKHFRQAEDSLNTMLGVVDEFLDSGILHEDTLRVDLTTVDSYQVVQKVAGQYTPAAQHKQIDLSFDEVRGTIQADVNRLEQVISNLLSNAIKYSPTQSRVTLSSEQTDTGWRLNVRDEGPGIPEAERATLFEPFHTASPRPTGGEHSSGLGLWIVKEMMDLQNGTVGVDCPPSGGSTFWIELPLAESSVIEKLDNVREV